MTTIRALRPSDDRALFRSGDVELDRFFTKYAGQNQFRHHIGTTYVAVDDDDAMLGFATVSAGAMEIDGLPLAVRKKLPSYPLPILRLARLAVGEGFQGKGVGTALLRFVLLLAVRMGEQFGCVGVVVDAKPNAIDFYASHGFEPVELLEGESPARPRPIAMFLPLNEIVAATK